MLVNVHSNEQTQALLVNWYNPVEKPVGHTYQKPLEGILLLNQ